MKGCQLWLSVAEKRALIAALGVFFDQQTGAASNYETEMELLERLRTIEPIDQFYIEEDDGEVGRIMDRATNEVMAAGPIDKLKLIIAALNR